MTRNEQVAWVRQALAACGGWNSRSRGVLRAWAASEGLDASTLESLVTEVAGAARRASRRSPSDARENVALARRRHGWWAVVGASLGLMVSAFLVQRLVERWPQSGAGGRGKPRAVSPAPQGPAAAEAIPDRTLPPVPIPFPRPPDVVTATADRAAESPLDPGPRPSGEARDAEVQAWRQSLLSLMTSWPDLREEERTQAVEALAAWLAGSPSADDLARLQSATQEALRAESDPARRMLADAFVAMLLDRAARSERLTPAAGQAFGTRAGSPWQDPLHAWALGQLATLRPALTRPEGRAPWAAWLRVVACMPDADDRVEVALPAIDMLLRSGNRLDVQGLPADVAGSLLQGIPASPKQQGFDRVRRAMAAWLEDASIDARALWALGGVWRTLPGSPSPALLPGERDSAKRRAQLAQAWLAPSTQPVGPPWLELQAALAEVQTGVPRDDAGWIDRAARLIELLGRIDQERRGQASKVAEVVREVPAAEDAPPAPPADRWQSHLADTAPERRLLGLDEIRTAQPSELGWLDGQLVACMALGGRSRDERDRALELLRGPLASTPSVRRGLLLEAAVTADLRRAVEVLEIAGDRSLPTFDPEALRRQALVALLLREGAEPGTPAVEAASARLRKACARWSGDSERLDPAATLWNLADRSVRRMEAVVLPAAMQPQVAGLQDCVRRLRRVASFGPRGVAAACVSLAASRAAWLAAERPDLAPELAATLRAERSEASEQAHAMPQACVALAWIARMELACLGATWPPPSDGAPPPEAGVLLSRAVGATGEVRRRLLEGAFVAGGGAMLPDPRDEDPEAGVSMLQTLAWCHRGQIDRVLKAKQDEPGRALVERLAGLRGDDLKAWLLWLQNLSEGDRWKALSPVRTAAMRHLRSDLGAWGDAQPQAAVPVP